jgi:hypothetical protein
MSDFSEEPEHIKKIRAAQEKSRKKAKLLRFRTGPVPKAEINSRFLVKVDDRKVVAVVKVGWEILCGDEWLPLSEILERVEG